MIRNYKGFMLALLAMCAFSAFAAQGATAKPLTIDGTPPPTVYITGTGTSHKFTVPGVGSVTCTSSQWSASKAPESGAISEITILPHYTGCTAFGFASTDIKVNGCQYTLTTPTSISAGVVTWHPANIHVCPGGQKIEITPTTFGASVCTQTIGKQTPTEGHITGSNVAGSSPMHATDEVTVKGITYTGTGGACGTAGANAEYSGDTTIKCYSDETHKTQIGCTFS